MRTDCANTHAVVNGATDGCGGSLTNIHYYWCKHPDAMERVRAEMDEALSPDDVIIPWSGVKYLPYLKACIDEG